MSEYVWIKIVYKNEVRPSEPANSGQAICTSLTSRGAGDSQKISGGRGRFAYKVRLICSYKDIALHWFTDLQFTILEAEQVWRQETIVFTMHTWYLSYFLHKQNFWINFSPHKSA